MELLRQINSLLTRRERWHLKFLLFALVIRAAVVTVGVAGIMPFMSVVAGPEAIQQNSYLAAFYDWAGFESVTAFLTALGVALVALIILSNVVSGLTTYAMVRFSWGLHHRLSMRLLAGYLSQPYAFFVARNSAALNKTLLDEVRTVITGVITPILDVGARILVVIAILALLVRVDPTLAATTAVVLGSVYGIIYMLIKRKQRALGKERVRANAFRYRAAGEAFGGIKDVKILQRETAFLKKFRPASWQYAKTNASNAVISQVPHYLLDTIAFGGIVLIVLYFLQGGDGVVEILPVISLYAFAGYRLMPELQKLFSDFAKLRFHRAALDDLLADYRSLPETPADDSNERLTFRSHIEVDQLSFSYPGAAVPALERISLRVDRNQTVGLVGASGSGKTTLVDLLLGLYPPDSGRILVDGVTLDENTARRWRRQVGYVPQTIFLIDDTLAANIAFGVPTHEIDHARVVHAARIAHLDAFVESLPEKYGTVVGERGVRLSGGQRQRIGIARALYQDPEILIMDEATSALDGATENAVMEAITQLAGKKTIVLIAHRLTTVRDCDVIFVLSEGKVEQSGSYEFLMQENKSFREFAGVTSEQ